MPALSEEDIERAAQAALHLSPESVKTLPRHAGTTGWHAPLWGVWIDGECVGDVGPDAAGRVEALRRKLMGMAYGLKGKLDGGQLSIEVDGSPAHTITFDARHPILIREAVAYRTSNE